MICYNELPIYRVSKSNKITPTRSGISAILTKN